MLEGRTFAHDELLPGGYLPACERCPLGVTRAVATRGPVPARLLLLSGAPRFHEELEGVAFASPAFGWLEEMLAGAGFDPASIHYATVTGCRPPHQRPLRSDEIGACGPRLDLTIRAVEPEAIVLCGAEAVAAMLPGITLGNSHGKLIMRGRRRYYPIRHPYMSLHYQAYIDEVVADLGRLASLLASGTPVPDDVLVTSVPDMGAGTLFKAVSHDTADVGGAAVLTTPATPVAERMSAAAVDAGDGLQTAEISPNLPPAPDGNSLVARIVGPSVLDEEAFIQVAEWIDTETSDAGDMLPNDVESNGRVPDNMQVQAGTVDEPPAPEQLSLF